MAKHNICHFVPHQSGTQALHILHYVLETDQTIAEKEQVETVYKIYCAVRGTAVYTLDGTSSAVRAGDVFFGFPSSVYAIRDCRDFQYVYIGFLGEKALAEMDKLQVSRRNFIFSGVPDAIPVFTRGIGVARDHVGLAGEGVLLFTLAMLGDVTKQKTEEIPAAATIKDYLDCRYCDENITLSSVGKVLSFSPKYISAVFRKAYHVGFSEYLTMLRIQHARVLMERGISGVKDIAWMCGFTDPAYFSRVFRKETGTSPSEYIASLI